MIFHIRGLLVASLVVLLGSQHTAEGQNAAKRLFLPDHESARANSVHLFNAIQSAGRQWGSSYIHNGFGLIPAMIKKGTLLYHGTYAANGARPQGLEYLAFEIEYSRAFSTSYTPGDRWSARIPSSSLQPPGEASKAKQRPLGKRGNETGSIRGYLQTYVARRDLNVLYIDGSAGAKADIGPLDSQDILLRGGTGEDQNGNEKDASRVADLCRMLKPYGIDAILRVEIGFELIYCDFQDSGLEQISTLRSFGKSDLIGDKSLEYFQWLRGVSQRYDGVGVGQVKFDFSSMVSGFMFPINVSNTDPDRPDLVRLRAAERDDLASIKNYFLDLLSKPRRFNVDWQAIVDLIIRYFGDRLAYMGSGIITNNHFIEELESATLAFLDAPARSDDVDWEEMTGSRSETNRTADAIERCTNHHLLAAVLDKDTWNLEDAVIHTAISDINGRICRDLYTARSIVLRATFPERDEFNDISVPSSSSTPLHLEAAISQARSIVHDLILYLAWPDWKRKRRCAVNEIELIAMWPFGTHEDHWSPGCRSIEDEMSFQPYGSYWLSHSRSRFDVQNSEINEV